MTPTNELLGGGLAAMIVLFGGCAGLGMSESAQDEQLGQFVASAEAGADTEQAIDETVERPIRIPPSRNPATTTTSDSNVHAPTVEADVAVLESASGPPQIEQTTQGDVTSHSQSVPAKQEGGVSQSTEFAADAARLQRTPPPSPSGDDNQFQPTSIGDVPPPGQNGTDVPIAPQLPVRDGTYPIDLANALAMGGANHLQIQIARQRVVEAHANWVQAAAVWVPDLQFGIAWTRHDGRIQATNGQVANVSRSSLFVGGGAGYGQFPLTGGAGGPARLMVNLSLADAIFERPVAERQLAAASAGESGTVNDSLRDIGVAYFSLVEAYSRAANARVGLQLSSEMVQLTTLFEQQGAGSQAAVDLAKTEEAFWKQAVQEAERTAFASAAELARMIRIDPKMKLVPADDLIVPVHLLDPSIPRDQLVAIGLASRPELAQQEALVAAAFHRTRQEHWRPLLPNVHVGASGGTFGGGPGGSFNSQSSRGDVDLIAVWELTNAGAGVFAQRRRRASQLAQARIQTDWLRDQVTAEIITAINDVESYQQQTETAVGSVDAAQDSYERNLQRVRAGEGLPIELLQAIRARANALDAHTQAIAEFNRAQCRLLRAVGRTVDHAGHSHVPTMPSATPPENQLPVVPEAAASGKWSRY